MCMKKFNIVADGAGRLDILSRITLLFSQRHVDVENLTFSTNSDQDSRYCVCAFATEDTINKITGQMAHIIGIRKVSYSEQA